MGKNNSRQETAQAYTLIVSLRDMVDSLEPLKMLVQEKPNGKPPSAAVSMTLFEVMSAAQPHLDNYEKALKQLREKYQAPVTDETGKAIENRFHIPPQNRALFEAEHGALLETMHSLPIGMISQTALANEGLGLTAQVLFALRWLIRCDAGTLFVPPEPATVPA